MLEAALYETTIVWPLSYYLMNNPSKTSTAGEVRIVSYIWMHIPVKKDFSPLFLLRRITERETTVNMHPVNNVEGGEG